MRVNLIPQRRDGSLTLVKNGDVLIINGQSFDFSAIPDGATLPFGAVDNEFITGDIKRINSELHIPILLPIGADASEAACFPEPIIDPTDGPLELPQ